MPLVQYLIANKGLGMSPGKLAAQVAHGAVQSAWHTKERNVNDWLDNGEMKIVLEARDTEHLLLAQKYIESKGIKTFLVIDEGRTEVPPLSATVLAVEILEKNDERTRMTFETFKIYKAEPIAEAVWYSEESKQVARCRQDHANDIELFGD